MARSLGMAIEVGIHLVEKTHFKSVVAGNKSSTISSPLAEASKKANVLIA